MAVKSGDFIKLNYSGYTGDILFDTTVEKVAEENGQKIEGKKYEPLIVRVGAGHVIPGLDETFEGKEIGKEYEIDIPCDKAYGQRDNKLVQSVPLKEFKEKPQIGMSVTAEGRRGVVVNVIGKRAVVDFNNMLAGRDLKYKYTIEGTVDEPVEQAKAVFALFIQKDFEMELKDKKLTVTLPPGITYDQRWMMGKGMAVFQTFDSVEGVEDIVLTESFKKPVKDEKKE